MTNKEEAKEFLVTLERTLNRRLPPAGEMERAIRTTILAAEKHENQKHLRKPEAAFLNGYALPILADVLRAEGGLSPEQARAALLNEYFRNMRELSERSPAGATRHPFRKVFDESADRIYRKWTHPEQGGALTQSCPDFALQAPHKVLFEGKYFARGSKVAASRELVKDIYQAFFYRGLPTVPATPRHPAWDYDYSCLLAYDATPTGVLQSAWTDVDAKVRRSFWEGANIYVMILRGGIN